MENENGNLSPLGEDESIIEEADSMYSLPQEAGEVLNVWILAKRLKKYRQMKKLEEVNGLGRMTGIGRDFHSSSPGDGVKVDDSADADAVAFDGDAGPEVSFVERDDTEVRDIELED